MNNLQSYLQNLAWMWWQSVEYHRTKIEWLLDFRKKYDAIAHFGCSIGYETHALMWLLNATETVGIDKDSDSIHQARSLQINSQQDIRNVQRTLQYHPSHLSDDIRWQLQESIKKFENLAFPQFIERDMTRTTGLTSNHFDLAYCERVLYHIACEKCEQAQDNIRRAIEEMMRVVKPSGFVVAIEPNTCSPDDATKVELKVFFEQVSLIPVEIDRPIFLSENETLYFYSRPNS